MQGKQVHVLTLDSILEESERFSEISLPLSFDLKDIENEKPQPTHVSDNFDDFFQEEDDSASISLTNPKSNPKSKSDTTKTLSKIDQIRSMSVIVKDDMVRNFVLKETMIDQKVFAKNVTFMNITNVSKPFEVSNKLVGLPTSIYATSSKFLAVGTSQSSVALFEMGVKNYRLMETVNKNKYGSTTSVAICKQNLFMVCGYQNGYLTIWDLTTFSLIKTIQSQMNNESILKLEFVKGTEFISSDIQGNVFLHTIQKYVWTSVKSKRLLTKSPETLYYDIRSIQTFNVYRVALVSYNSLILISVDPIEVIHKFERPQGVSSTSVPIADIGIFKNGETEQNYILISWGTKLYIYLLNPLSRTQPILLKSIYEHSLNLISLQILSSASLILLDSSGTYRIISLISHLNNVPNIIKSQGILKNDILIGKCRMQDNKYKITSNTVCKTTSNFNEIFFITQGGMFRCRFHKWTEMIYYLIENAEYLQALKCAIEIFNGRLDIFSERVVISPKTMVLFNDMITYYINIRLKQIRTLSPEQIKEIILTSIEYCVQINSYQHLFTKVFSIIGYNFHLQKQFIQCLEIFIRSHLIKRIPNFLVLEKVINYYTQYDSGLVDTLILSLDPFSIDYYATLDVCVTHKLYSSLIYISQVNNDFVSPANKIIEACEEIREKGGSGDTIQEYTALIYLEMVRLLEGKTIAGTQLSESGIELGISTLSLWFTIQENMRDLVDYNGVLYFQILEKLFSNDTVIESFQENNKDGYDKLLSQLKRLAAGYKEYEQALVNVILRVNEITSLKKEMIEHCIKHLGGNVNHKSLENFVDKNSQAIEEILTKSVGTQFMIPNELQALMLINNKKFEKALQLYSKVDHQQRHTLFTRMSDQLANDHFQKLVQLDPDSTAHYVYSHFTSTHIVQLVSKLPQNPHAYLFIRRLKRQDKPINQLKLKKSWQLFYLQSLCKYKTQHRVLYQLQSQTYPREYIEQSLKIIQRYKLKECEAYLIQPSMDSFSLYKQLYISKFALELQKLFSYKYSNSRDYQRVLKSIFKMLEVVHHQLQFFTFVIQQFNLPSKKKKDYSSIGKQIEDIADKKTTKDNPFINTIRWMIETFLNVCARGASKEHLVVFFQQNKQVLELKFMVGTVTATLSKLNLSVSIYSTISSIILNDDVYKFDRILELKGTTFYCKPICRGCSLYLTDGITSSILFECGHCFHMECAMNYQVCQLCNESMYVGKRERRQTVMLEESRRRNLSVRQVQVNAMDSYVAFDEMRARDGSEEDWSMPQVEHKD